MLLWVADELLMPDGQFLVELSTSPYHCGWHPPPKSFFKTFLFLLVVRAADTLKASVEKSLLMVQASFPLLYFFSRAARATRLCCFQSGCDRGVSELPLPFLVFGCISFGYFTEFANV